jgi:release factor glutamine methyltransferase
VEWTLAHLPAEKTIHIADLGTGSGAIALALAKERPNWQIDATDYSKKALAIASENARQLQLSQVNFHQGNWCKALPKHQYDVILSNPPYIEENDPHLLQLKYEPKEALVAGIDGLSALTKIIQTAHTYLKPNGYLLLEHGFNQAEKVAALLKNAGYGYIESHQDLASIPRMTVSQIGSQHI